MLLLNRATRFESGLIRSLAYTFQSGLLTLIRWYDVIRLLLSSPPCLCPTHMDPSYLCWRSRSQKSVANAKFSGGAFERKAGAAVLTHLLIKYEPYTVLHPVPQPPQHTWTLAPSENLKMPGWKSEGRTPTLFHNQERGVMSHGQWVKMTVRAACLL